MYYIYVCIPLPPCLHPWLAAVLLCFGCSVRWIERHINDRYVMKAQQENYRSRAAYKLMQMDDRFCFLKRHQVVVDLGCYPGGWSQVSKEGRKERAHTTHTPHTYILTRLP